MLDPDARHPEARRGRHRGRGTAWGAFAGVALAIVLGGLFWVAVWDALRPSTVTDREEAAELVVAALPSVDADDALIETADDALEASLAPPGPAVEHATDVPDERGVAAAMIGAAGEPAADAVEGPADAEKAREEPGPDEAISADTAGEQDAEATEPAPDKVEELTARLEQLTEKLEALTARLEDPGAAATAQPTGVPVPLATPTRPAATARARAPWVLLPHPEPGSRVTAGPLVLETRARGEAPITQVRLLLDGVALPITLERRDDTTWRARAATRVGPGKHAVAVAVVDAQGRTGSYRWQFDAGSP